jgi:hypothetical protein
MRILGLSFEYAGVSPNCSPTLTFDSVIGSAESRTPECYQFGT